MAGRADAFGGDPFDLVDLGAGWDPDGEEARFLELLRFSYDVECRIGQLIDARDGADAVASGVWQGDEG